MVSQRFEPRACESQMHDKRLESRTGREVSKYNPTACRNLSVRECFQRTLWVSLWVSLCNCSHRSQTDRRHNEENNGVIAGLYWGHWPEVEQGIRVAVWADSDGERVRGTWSMPPWSGELEGTMVDGEARLNWREEGVVAGVENRERTVRLVRDNNGVWVENRADRGEGITLHRARFGNRRLHPGLWLSHWTGLPKGMAVETTIVQSAPGRWRASYRYQGRDGTFDGTERSDGKLQIQWHEVSQDDTLARGEGLLSPSALGFRGTFGVNDAASGTGSWSLEPAGED